MAEPKPVKEAASAKGHVEVNAEKGKLSGFKINNSFPFNRPFRQNREISRFSSDCKVDPVFR
jgi:hypothetical protein